MKYSENEVRLYALARERSLIDDVEGVAEALRQLLQLRPDSALFNASLANALNGLGQVDVAEHLFKKAVSLAPRSEKISLGLFHCLWAAAKQEEALEEMKRFLSLVDSEEYPMLLASITKSLNERDQL
jgi:predicted Zn-dependent protease